MCIAEVCDILNHCKIVSEMPETRDIMSSHDGVVTAYINQKRRVLRSGNRNAERSDSVAFVLEDAADEAQDTSTPFRWRGTMRRGVGPAGSARGSTGKTRRYGFYPSPAAITGRENLSPFAQRALGRGRGRSVLPSWYPRKPLQDITAVVRAIERTRKRLGETEPLQPSTPIFHEQTVHDPSAASSSSHASLKHDISMGKVPKILLDITNQNNADSDCLTPQKKLLHNSDTAEKVMMKELRKLKRTPSAKKAEREERVHTLMSMR